MIKKIVIAGASTFTVKNLGDEAMLLNLIQAIKRYDKKIKITLLSRHPSKYFDKLYGIKTIKNFEFNKRKQSIGKFFYGFNSNKHFPHIDKVRNELIKADMFILAGNLFMELFPNSFLRGVASYSTTLAILSKFCNTNIYIASLNVISEFRSPIVKEYLKFLSKVTTKVLVREKNAKKNLLGINFDPKKVSIEGESAFGVDVPIKKKIISNLINNKKFTQNKKKIISVCIRVEYWKNKIDKNFFKKQAKILGKISELTGATLLFVPNGFSKARKWMDDRDVHKEIIKRLSKKTQYLSITKDLNVYESINLHSVSDFHITNRRHSIVFAVLNKISTAIINTNLKGHLEPLSKDINLSENLINFNDDEEKIIKKIVLLWKKRELTVKKMTPRINFLRVKAKNQFKKLISA